MSRSYKKTPYCGDTKHRSDKRRANHRVRQMLKRDMDYVPKHSDFKK